MALELSIRQLQEASAGKTDMDKLCSCNLYLHNLPDGREFKRNPRVAPV